MEDLKLELKKNIIELLNLEDVTVEEIKDNDDIADFDLKILGIFINLFDGIVSIHTGFKY